jgi:N-acetylglucosaminyl-diphospho-decaprenol L-rhamnosyltransferase
VSGTAPRVDVGIVTHNTRDLTLRAVEQVLGADPGLDLRVLVRDNGSADGTAAAVRERFPQVSVDEGDNVGFARGVNALLSASSAPWFVTLNSDAWPEPGALSGLLRAAERHPRAAAVAPLLLRPDGSLEHSTHPLPSLRVAAVTGLGLTALLGRDAADRMCLHGAWAHDRERSVGWAVGAALLFRRSALETLGAFDETLFMYAEDLDWCWRAGQQGWEVWFTPDAVVRHVGNASGSQRYGADRERVVIGNANVVARRHLGRARSDAWRLLNAAGAARLTVKAAVRRDRATARFWRDQISAHLGGGTGR